MCRPVGFAAILFTVALCIGFVFQDVQDSVAAAAGTRSWIDAPLNGSNLPLAAVEVVSHSTNPSGISRVELSVDGEVVGTADNSDTSQSLLVARMEWKPSAPGNYTIMVRAQDTSGSWGSYAKSVVTIAGVAKTITPTVTPKIVITVTPTVTATSVPPSPTATPTPKQEEPPAGGQEVVRLSDTVIQREPTIQEIIPTRQVPPVQQVPTVLPLAAVSDAHRFRGASSRRNDSAGRCNRHQPPRASSRGAGDSPANKGDGNAYIWYWTQDHGAGWATNR